MYSSALAICVATVVLVATSLSAAQAPVDHCSQYKDCTDCVNVNLCGWCSVPVVYPGNITGTQCAGFNANGSDPFACNGVYSTDTCARGYKCDLYNFECVPGEAGGGETKAECEANCTNHGQVYKCNHTEKKCNEVPAGTPGAMGYGPCEASCVHPSAHPASPSPVAQTFSCNHTTGKCDKAAAGHGSSKSVCEAECKQTNGTMYFCEQALNKCVKAPSGVPGGKTKAACEAECGEHPHPGPPPTFEGGIWRGIAIQQGFKVGEWDMEFTQTSARIVDISSATTIKGVPYHFVKNDTIDLWINITSGPGAGKVMKAISQSHGRGPETTFMTAAFGAAGGPTPASITSAMTKGSGEMVFFLSQCAGTPECIFTMPDTSAYDRIIRSRLAEFSHTGILSMLGDLHEDSVERELALGVSDSEAGAEPIEGLTDPCTAYAANCSYCLSHPFCGWCSSDVTYKDGKKGSQCAGFAKHKNQSNPFICDGRYSTLNCTVGYNCDESTSKCVPNPKGGNGMPLKICEEFCKPTPSPTPNPGEWVCNITEKKCHKCPQTHCAGAMPKAQCEASCKKPKPHPSPLVQGGWRGLKIQQKYPLGEYEVYFNASAVTFYKNDKMTFDATVESFGGDVMVFTDKADGSKYSCLYSIADQGAGLYEVMTLAVSAAGGSIPQTFAPAMETQGMYEMVLAKCNGKPCSFPRP